MNIQFTKMVQFSLLVKTGERLREFNFRKLKNPGEDRFSVNVCDDRGDRILFTMQKKENDWEIIPAGAAIPPWITQNETVIRQAMEEEIRNW